MERDKRFSQTGVNSAGDRVYTRTYEGTGEVLSDGYDDLTKPELAARLEHMGLPKSGTKDELIARLREAD